MFRDERHSQRAGDHWEACLQDCPKELRPDSGRLKEDSAAYRKALPEEAGQRAYRMALPAVADPKAFPKDHLEAADPKAFPKDHLEAAGPRAFPKVRPGEAGRKAFPKVRPGQACRMARLGPAYLKGLAGAAGQGRLKA